MGSTRRSPPCSRSRTTGVLAGSSNRTPRSSISTTSSTLPPCPSAQARCAGGGSGGLAGSVELPHEGVGIRCQGGQVGGGDEREVAVALGVPEAVADDVVVLHGEADPPQRHRHHPAPHLVHEGAHVDRTRPPPAQLAHEVGGGQPR